MGGGGGHVFPPPVLPFRVPPSDGSAPPSSTRGGGRGSGVVAGRCARPGWKQRSSAEPRAGWERGGMRRGMPINCKLDLANQQGQVQSLHVPPGNWGIDRCSCSGRALTLSQPRSRLLCWGVWVRSGPLLPPPSRGPAPQALREMGSHLGGPRATRRVCSATFPGPREPLVSVSSLVAVSLLVAVSPLVAVS